MNNVRIFKVDWYSGAPIITGGGYQLAYQGDDMSNMVIFDKAPNLDNYYLLVKMKLDEADAEPTVLPYIRLEGPYWVVPNYYTQIPQTITFQCCCRTPQGDYEHHSAWFTGAILPTIKHNGNPIDQSPMFDPYIDILDKRVNELVVAAGDVVIDSELNENSGNPVQNKVVARSVGELNERLIGESVDATGGLLVAGYYVKNNRQVTASSNFVTYKYSLSGVKYVEITTYGYNSTVAVASDSDYDASTLPGKTFSATDVLIYPSTTIGAISPWTENAIVDGYDYLYVSCYKNNTPTVKFYTGDGAYPISLSNSAEIVTLKARDLSAMRSYTTLINTADKWVAFGNNANNLTPNGIYCISYASGISNLPYSTFNGFIQAFMAYYGNSTIWMQKAVNSTGKRNFVRVLWSGTWTPWEELALNSTVEEYGADIQNLYFTNELWKVFHKVGVIGDSLASGECASNEGGNAQYHDLYPFSWAQCMARDSNNTYYNFSKGGLTTKTWMTDTDYGYALASQPDKLCDMYIIGLGQNDAAQSMAVGSSADINYSNPDANADSFYGNYAKIIQKMQVIAPKAPIFVCTRPTVPASNAYETAIRTMPTLFDNVYLLDMYKHVNAYYDANSIIRRCLRSGHYNAVGYQVMSKHIEEEISNVIKDNLNDFLQVEFINTDWSWT